MQYVMLYIASQLQYITFWRCFIISFSPPVTMISPTTVGDDETKPPSMKLPRLESEYFLS